MELASASNVSHENQNEFEKGFSSTFILFLSKMNISYMSEPHEKDWKIVGKKD